MILGLDPSLNNVGYCFLEDVALPVANTVKPPKEWSQFEKMYTQAKFLGKILDENDGHISCVGIEQPYVASFGGRGAGGHQSANMWAVYSMMLAEIRIRLLPVVMFNITQLHSLIIRRKGITKQDIMAAAIAEAPTLANIDEHQADAYFVAKHARAFWGLMDRASINHLTPDQKDIFLSQRTGKKGDRSGIVWRPGDFWFDFRKSNPTLMPPQVLECLSKTL